MPRHTEMFYLLVILNGGALHRRDIVAVVVVLVEERGSVNSRGGNSYSDGLTSASALLSSERPKPWKRSPVIPCLPCRYLHVKGELTMADEPLIGTAVMEACGSLLHSSGSLRWVLARLRPREKTKQPRPAKRDRKSPSSKRSSPDEPKG